MIIFLRPVTGGNIHIRHGGGDLSHAMSIQTVWQMLERQHGCPFKLLYSLEVDDCIGGRDTEHDLQKKLIDRQFGDLKVVGATDQYRPAPKLLDWLHFMRRRIRRD